MRAYKCDRCGAFATRNIFVRTPSRYVYRFGKKNHLCSKCVASFDKWLKNPEEEVVMEITNEERRANRGLRTGDAQGFTKLQ